MRTLQRSVLALGMILLVGSLALGQRFGFGGGGGQAGPNLLSNKSVQEELKLTAEQKEKIGGILKELGEKQRAVFAELKEQGVDFREMFQKGAEKMKPHTAEARKAIAPILQAEQAKRFRQIELQRMGVAAFDEADVQAALKLSDEKKAEIKTLRTDMEKDMQEVFRELKGGDFKEIGTKTAAITKETMDKVRGLLSAEQKASYQQLVGERFEYKPDTGDFKGKFRKKDK